MKRVLALIPARKNSKGIPGKNIRPIAGKPLIAWTIEAALQSEQYLDVVCSTDCPEIAEVAKEYGAEVPFMRPAHLATDDASSLGVVLHALDVLGGGYERVLLLQPTSPLRTNEDISGALRLDAEAVVSVREAEEHPYLAFQSIDGFLEPFCQRDPRITRRQDFPSAWILNGAIYLTPVEQLRTEQTFLVKGTVGYPMPNERSTDIDIEEDWKLAEDLLRKRQANDE